MSSLTAIVVRQKSNVGLLMFFALIIFVLVCVVILYNTTKTHKHKNVPAQKNINKPTFYLWRTLYTDYNIGVQMFRSPNKKIVILLVFAQKRFSYTLHTLR